MRGRIGAPAPALSQRNSAHGGVRATRYSLTVPILTWLNPSGVDAETAAGDQIDVAIGSVDELEALLAHASSGVGICDVGSNRSGTYLRRCRWCRSNGGGHTGSRESKEVVAGSSR